MRSRLSTGTPLATSSSISCVSASGGRPLRQHVDDGALALITPLRADHDDVATHN
jgi:hypothetical protein